MNLYGFCFSGIKKIFNHSWVEPHSWVMDDKASVGKISVSSDSVSTLNSEDFVLVSRQGDETPSTNNGSDDEKTGLKVKFDSQSVPC